MFKWLTCLQGCRHTNNIYTHASGCKILDLYYTTSPCTHVCVCLQTQTSALPTVKARLLFCIDRTRFHVQSRDTKGTIGHVQARSLRIVHASIARAAEECSQRGTSFHATAHCSRIADATSTWRGTDVCCNLILTSCRRAYICARIHA
jgi:hypothetical protein